MAGRRGSETEFEYATIDRFIERGYQWVYGSELPRDDGREVVGLPWLRDNLASRYPELPEASLVDAIKRITRPEGVDTLCRNRSFHAMLAKGIEVRVDRPEGPIFPLVYPIDWANPEANDFRIVNQLSVAGGNDRRPDLVIYVNGLPLALFELKNPYSEAPSVNDALNQIGHYVHEIPQLFDYNELCVVSDGVNTLHGMWTADEEWYAPWKSIDGLKVYSNEELGLEVLADAPRTLSSMKVLVEGLFEKSRLLSYLRDFIVFESANEVVTKKGARYHQFFAVHCALRKTLETLAPGADRRIGVIWHTTGSGKSLSMVFLVGILRRLPELKNPSFVIQVDRNDLDEQLSEQFVAAVDLVGESKHAEDSEGLREALRTQGGEIVLTTIEKFRLREGETRHELLSARSNIIVIADEAHRSQYGFEEGFARYLDEALPNARRLGFTGTPVSIAGADTEAVFGEVIHTYDILQSQEDGATVPIYYTPRLTKLQLSEKDIDAAFAEIAKAAKAAKLSDRDLERRTSRWTALAAAAGSADRVKAVAADLLAHFLDRSASLEGKAIAVCMTRENCVRLYEALRELPGCPEIAIVMTGDLGKDPKSWSEKGYYSTKAKRKIIKKRMKDLDDPLKLVIVCDMWLTGTDIPCLHTLYLDKPMRGHSMIQAISRVNRVFKDKPHGLIVDYIGIGDELRDATKRYTKGGGRGSPAPEVEAAAKPVFFRCLAEAEARLVSGRDYSTWRSLSTVALEDLYAENYGTLMADEERRQAFLLAELRLANAFLLVKHLPDCKDKADEVVFCQRIRRQLEKVQPGRRAGEKIEKAVRDLVDDSVGSEGVVDIFDAAGLPKADLSILDESFLQTFAGKKREDLRLKLLERLIEDAIELRAPKNRTAALSFRQRLERTLNDYRNRVIDAAKVVEEMIAIRKAMEADAKRACDLGLSEEELAFYDAVRAAGLKAYEEPLLRDLIHEVVAAIKRNLKVDWTEEYRDDVRSSIRSAVKRVLRKNDVREEDLESITNKLIEQAQALWAQDLPAA